jgi:hypothetical protein
MMDQGDDYAQDLGGVYDQPPSFSKKFEPWHKPRKQFVREKQWTALIESLIIERGTSPQSLNYRGLPGDDSLDIRHFHDVICAPKQLQLRFLGFNTNLATGHNTKSAVEVSLDEITRLPYIHKKSDLSADDFVAISGETIAWDKALEMAPFDVINLDLCDSVAKEKPDVFAENHYNTIHKLMTLQSSSQKRPWLLFLTTRTDEDLVNPVVLRNLKKIYKNNLDCPAFSEKSLSNFAVSDESSLNEYCKKSKGFSNIFLLSFSKWILGMGLNQAPQSNVEIKDIMGYKVLSDSTSDMYSIALKITPTLSPPIDVGGLAKRRKKGITECEKAIEMFEMLALQKNVDQVLKTDQSLNIEMMNNTSLLLEKARYDKVEYINWAKAL